MDGKVLVWNLAFCCSFSMKCCNSFRSLSLKSDMVDAACESIVVLGGGMEILRRAKSEVAFWAVPRRVAALPKTLRPTRSQE